MQQVSIRFVDPGDVLEIATAVQESLPDLIPWMGWATPEYGEREALSWIEAQVEARERRTEFSFVATDPDGRILGICGINQINTIHQFANIGYWTRSSEAGKGVAVAAVRELERWVFSETNLERLEIVVACGNRRSERVAEKAGAHREGVLRSRLLIRGEYHDASMFSLVRAGRPRETSKTISPF